MSGHLSMNIGVTADGAVDCSVIDYEIVLDTDFVVKHSSTDCGYFFGRTKFFPDAGDASGNIDDPADLNSFSLAATTFTLDGVAKGFNAASETTPVVGGITGGRNCYALKIEIWRDKTFGGLTEGWRCRAILYIEQVTLDGTVTGNPPGTLGCKINAGALLSAAFNTDDLTGIVYPVAQPCGSLSVATLDECVAAASNTSHVHDLGGGDGWISGVADVRALEDFSLDAVLENSQCCNDDSVCVEDFPDEDGTCLIAP